MKRTGKVGVAVFLLAGFWMCFMCLNAAAQGPASQAMGGQKHLLAPHEARGPADHNHPGYQGIWKDDSVVPTHNFYIQHYLQGDSTVVIYTRDGITFFSFIGTITGSNSFSAASMGAGTPARNLSITFSSPTTGTATITDNTLSPPVTTTINIVKAFQAIVTYRSGIWKDATGTFNMYVQEYSTGSTVIVYTFDAKDFKAFLANMSGNTFSGTSMGIPDEQMTAVFSNQTSGQVTVSPTSQGSMKSQSASFSYNPVTKIYYPVPVPVVAFTANPKSGTAPLTVSFTDQSTGVKETYIWSFGDGGVSTDPNPSHTYTAEGTYDVMLSVSNISGTNTLTKADYITVSATGTPPSADFTASPTNGAPPLSVHFQDQSTGSPTSWEWNFGDAGDPTTVQSTAQNPTHVYTNPGVYSVRLKATNAHGSNQITKTNLINVGGPPASAPTADFTGSPTSGNAPLTVVFQDQSTGAPTLWLWDFGDGSTSFLQNPTHTYTAVGTYTVQLTVVNGTGMDVKKRLNYITVTTSGSSTRDMGYGGF